MKKTIKVMALTLVWGLLSLSASAENVAEVINASGGLVETYDSANDAFGAIASGSDGSTLRLLADCTVTACGDFGKSFTLDLNGFTLTADYTSEGSDNYFLSPATSGKTLTIKNGKFVCGSRCKGIVDLISGTLIMEGVTVTKTTSATTADIQQRAGSTAIRNCVFDGANRCGTGVYVGGGDGVVEDCEVTVNQDPASGGGTAWQSAALRVSGNATLTVKGGTYTSPAYSLYILTSGGTINVEDGNFSGPIYLDGSNNTSYGRMNIKGGDFTSVTKFGGRNGTYNAYTVTGGTFASDPSKDVLTIASGYEVKDNGDGTYTVQKEGLNNYAAKIGEDYYETVSAAFSAAASGDTITLLKDCTMTSALNPAKDIALNLNQKTLTGEFSGETWYYAFEVKSPVTLTIKNGMFVCKGMCRGVGSPAVAGAKIVADSVTCIANTSSDKHCQSFYVSLGSLVARNCIMNESGRRQAGIAVDDGGSATIENCSITVSQKLTSNLAASDYYKSAAVYVSYKAEVTVKSGTYSSVTYPLCVLNSGGTINVKGGTFAGALMLDGNGQVATGKDGKGYCSISGGTFSNVSFGFRSGCSAYNTYAIVGGTFDADPTAYVDTETYEIDSTIPGKYVVRLKGQEEKTVATVRNGSTTEECSSLDAALAKVAVDGAVVTVLEDCTLGTSFAPTVSCTLDLGEKTVTVEDEGGFGAAAGGKTLTVENGTVCAANGGRLVIGGGEFNCAVNSVGSGSRVEIAGGAFGVFPESTDDGAFEISGGIFYAESDDYGDFFVTYCKSGYVAEYDDMDGVYTVKKMKSENTVAQIGDVPFDTLAEAFAEVKANETITIIKDCTMSAEWTAPVSCTVDFGGKTITSSVSGYAFGIASGSDLVTLKLKNGTFVAANNADAGFARIYAGILSVEGVTVSAPSASTQASVRASGGKVSVKDCVFNGERRQASGVYADGGAATVESSTVIVKSGTAYSNAPVRVASGATLLVKSGTYTAASGGFAAYVLSSGGLIAIEGGTFSGTVKSDYNASTYGYKKRNCLAISGGDLSAAPLAIRDDYNLVTVTGGTFATDPSKYIPADSGLVATKTGDVWIVGEPPPKPKKGVLLRYF